MKEVGIGDDHGGEGMHCTDAAMEGARFGDQSQTGIAPCAELKDKGICLFPFSVLLHYHGPNWEKINVWMNSICSVSQLTLYACVG